MMSFHKDTALPVLQRITEIWQIDPARQRWLPTDSSNVVGFDWWPGDFSVGVRAIPPPQGADHDGFKLLVRTDFLKDVAITSERFELMTADLSRFSTSCYAWIYPPKALWDQFPSSGSAPTLWLSGSAYINSSNMGWMTEFIANTSIIQPINAQIQSASMSKMLGSGAPDKSKPYPDAVTHLDDILEVVAQVYAPLGKQPSRFANTGEFEEFSSKYAQCDVCFGHGDPSGMTLETPFGKDSALIRFHTSEQHPQLGHGLLVTLQLPWFGKKIVMAREIAELNLLEYLNWTGFPQLGCWHNSESQAGQDGIAFTFFVPNALHKPGLVTQIAFWFIERARWVRQQKFPDMQDSTMAEILEERFGTLKK